MQRNEVPTFDEIVLLVIVLALIMIVATFVIIGIEYVNAEKYSYNMTEEDLKEERLLEVCIQLHIEAPACSMIWGGLDTSNGEKLVDNPK